MNYQTVNFPIVELMKPCTGYTVCNAYWCLGETSDTVVLLYQLSKYGSLQEVLPQWNPNEYTALSTKIISLRSY